MKKNEIPMPPNNGDYSNTVPVAAVFNARSASFVCSNCGHSMGMLDPVRVGIKNCPFCAKPFFR